MAETAALDVVCLGRAAVDLYGQQVGGRLEDVQSFAKYLGGSSGNLAVGLARLGRRSAMLTRVGDEHLGRFVREQLAREGVDVSHVKTDPDRLTGLVVRLGGPFRTLFGGGETVELDAGELERASDGVVHLRITKRDARPAA